MDLCSIMKCCKIVSLFKLKGVKGKRVTVRMLLASPSRSWSELGTLPTCASASSSASSIAFVCGSQETPDDGLSDNFASSISL
jgi:hypothetical protein